MTKFNSVAEAVTYFENTKIAELGDGMADEKAGVGEQCMLTGGPSDCTRRSGKATRVVTAFWIKGVRVSSKGPHGSRRITVLGFKERYFRQR